MIDVRAAVLMRDGRGPRQNERCNDRLPELFVDRRVRSNGNEPTIPAGVSSRELDRDAMRAGDAVGPNCDIVARHLVMAGWG